MRLLWFSSKPPSGAKGLKKSVGGGWIESLETQLMSHSDIDLGIVFTQLEKESKEIISESSSTRYFMVPRHPYGKFDRWVNRFFATPISEKPLKGYLQVVENFKPDIVLFFGTESDFPLIIPELKVPSIIWFQGNLTVYERMYENGLYIRNTIKFERLKKMIMGDTLLHNYWNFRRKVVREKRIFSMAKNFIGRTNWDRRVVSSMAPRSKYYHCDEAMRESFWNNQWTQWPRREKFIIFTTIQDGLYKGLETVYETAHLLVDKLEIDIEWRVAGISSNSAYAKAAQEKAKINLTFDRVNLLGPKPEIELVDQLLNADVYVHPSHIENSPNAVQEAMLLGMPVIATNVGGTPSLLVDGKEGLLVQNKDPFALAGAIFELFKNPEKTRLLGENARKRGLERNDADKICSDLLAIFQSMLKKQ